MTRQSSLLLSISAATTLLALMMIHMAHSQDYCEMSLWVYDTQDRCKSIDPPNAVGTLYADGQCRTTSTDISPTSADYSLFPGNYRAECTSNGEIRFLESGCMDSDCSATSLASDAICDRDTTKIAALYSRLNPPEYEVQATSGASIGGLYKCLRILGSGINVTFVVFGDCSQPGCMVEGELNPIPNGPSPPTAPAPVEPAPTNAPIRTPTNRPVPAPTDAPVPAPITDQPTRKPTPSPTNSPVDTPITFEPTLLPSGQPTVAPIAEGEPTRTPIIPTTFAPVPIAAPVSKPTNVDPNNSWTEQVDVGLRFFPMRRILPTGDNEETGLSLWEALTVSQIKDEAVELGIDVISIDIVDVEQSLTAATGGAGRVLQGLMSLDIYFTVILTRVMTDSLEPSVKEVVQRAFASEKDRNNYLISFVNADDPDFDSLRVISVIEVSRDDKVAIGDSNGSSVDENIGIISGAVVGMLVALAITGFFLYRHRKQSKDLKESAMGNGVIKSKGKEIAPAKVSEPSTHSGSNPQGQQGWTNEIVLNPLADDVSTLGGSVLAGLNLAETGNHGEDEPTASVNLDYDYDHGRYRTDPDDIRSRSIADASGTAFTNFSKLGLLGDSVFEDDVSFEQQYADEDDEDLFGNDNRKQPKPFEVRAPPGMLGMVIDTPNAGVPVIRAIKPDSILKGRVQIGDRLISVDLQDVTSMTALEVSNLISVKSNKQRLLVFVRLTNDKV